MAKERGLPVTPKTTKPASPEQRNDLQQQEEKTDHHHGDRAARGAHREGQRSIAEPQVDETG